MKYIIQQLRSSVNYRKLSVKMKRILPLVLLFLMVNSVEGIPDSLYYRANEKYQAGEYEKAIELYQEIITNGFESSVLYFNLGNAYFRSNKIGMSRLYYEKALKLDPDNEDASVNLNYISNLLVDKFETIPEIFLKRWLKSLISLMNSDNWAMLSMITFVLSLVSFSLYLLFSSLSIRKPGFFAGLIFLTISLISFGFSWKQHRYEVVPSSAIVTESFVNVKSTPRDTGTDLFVLHEGAKVWLEDIAG